MFGLEGGKKGKKDEKFIFELERELSDPKKRADIKKRVEKRLQEIKDILREGENKVDFERFSLIMGGYSSILKVISRFEKS